MNLFKRPEKKQVEYKSTGGRRWWLVAAGGAALVLGVVLFIIFMSHPKVITLGIGAVFGMMGGGFAVYYGFKPMDEGIKILKPGQGKEKLKQANCFNIYYNPKGQDYCQFEHVEDISNLEGHPRKCRNDHKYYWVNISDNAFRKKKESDKLTQFLLPDTTYRDPREFSNNLNIPAHRRLAMRKASLFEKVSPGLILIAMVIVAVFWIATTPTPIATNSTITNQTPMVQQ